MRELEDASKDLESLEKQLPGFYLGQGAVYVIEQQHMKIHNDILVPNGPKFTLHAWNACPTMAANVDNFYKATNDGKLLQPMVQEHALFFAVSRDLIDHESLAKAYSNNFPTVKFKSMEGTILVAGGHHRMKVLAKSNQELLQLKEKCSEVINNANQIRRKPTVIATARDELVNVSQTLWDNGKWGVIFLDLGL